MLIKESQLRAIIREELIREHQELLEETFMQDLAADYRNLGFKGALSATLLNFAAGSVLAPNTANALSPNNIISTVNKVLSGTGRSGQLIEKDDIIYMEKGGKLLRIMTSEESKNIDKEELENIVYALEDNASGSEIMKLIKDAIESSGSEGGDRSKKLISDILELNDYEIKEIIDEFKKSESGFNLHIMAYEIAAPKMIKQGKMLAQSLENDEKKIIVYLIMEKFPKYKEYLPAR